MTSIDAIAKEFPLHWCIWNDNHIELQDLLKDEKVLVGILSINCDSRRFKLISRVDVNDSFYRIDSIFDCIEQRIKIALNCVPSTCMIAQKWWLWSAFRRQLGACETIL